MILLDDAQSTAAKPSSRIYRNPIYRWQVLPTGDLAEDRKTVDQSLSEITKALENGQFVVGTFAYELGRLIHYLPSRNIGTSAHPYIEAWAFSDFESLSKQEIDAQIDLELEKLSDWQALAGVANVRNSINEERFCSDIHKIQEYIRAGDTYQINYTYRITGQLYGSPLALFKRLRECQPVRFGAFIDEGSCYLLSQSPELFIERKGNILKAMPMKGTASALSETGEALAQDPKNQAENVMIVDLLRNDLSRIALPNTVTVPKLFEVSRHGDVLQMTSTVQGQAKPNLSVGDILKAVFPCGSVTGAPKKRSMEIIQELESLDRNYYCGAIGWLDPNGDFAFSVPIRTTEIIKSDDEIPLQFSFGVGAGITIDSSASEEWQECQIKSNFLTTLPSATGLFETIAVHQGKPQRLELHLDRIQTSAAFLGITFDLLAAKTMILQACTSLDPALVFRLRLDLTSHGQLNITTGLLDPLCDSVKIFWAKDILPGDNEISSKNLLAGHKISHRPIYDAAWRKAQELGGFDTLLLNEHGFVCEGGRSNIFIRPKASQEWLTPPLSAGVLPGVMRGTLLSDPHMNAREANLTIKDVSMADEIILTNALRGAMQAHF